jgi:acyl-CoA thioesterase YciA
MLDGSNYDYDYEHEHEHEHEGQDRRSTVTASCATILGMEDKPKGELVIRTIAMPADTNPSGDIFGGWIISQMDLGSGILAAKVARTRVVTVAIEGMSFLRPVKVGDRVACYAWVEKIGRTSMVIPVEVWVQRYMSGEEVLVTKGVFTYVALGPDGKPVPVERA